LLKQEDFIKGKLVELGWRFGSLYGGHLAGQMVMCVLATRFRLGWGSYLDVLAGVPNFMAENELPPLVLKTTWDASFVKLLHAVDGIYEGSVSDLAKGAIYWCDTNRVEREWFRDKIIRAKKEDGTPAHPLVSNMGSLSFFK